MKRVSVAAFLLAFSAAAACGQRNMQPGVQPNVEYAVHDGVSLVGDLYSPESAGPHPAMVFIHGGGFARGSKAGYGTTWGPYLAARGYVVLAIDYRLSTPTQTTWPQALLDCKAAVQYLRGKASTHGIDPDRIGVGGDSAGATLAALVGVTQDFPQFANRYPKDAYATVSTKVKVVVPMYGVYDMMAWQRYTAAHNNNALEQFIGGGPEQMPGAYFESSALDYIREAATSLGSVATANPGAKIAWFLAWGMVDPVVPPEGQSVAFAQALRDAGAKVTAVPVPNTDHFWFPISPCSGATPNDFIVSQLLEFLARNL
jgi:acetyl esterase/lipase